MKRYLVTGGAGFIGSAITNKLIKEGNFVRVLDNTSRGSKNSVDKSSKLQFIDADIRDPEIVEKACRNIDSIIHLAFINGTKYFYEKPDLVLDVGVNGMTNVLKGAKKNKVRELFLASSSEVYQTPPKFPTPEDVPYSIPDPHNPRYSYAGGKIISELMSLHIGKTFFEKVVIFRPHNVYGPRMGTEHVIPELIKKIIIARSKSDSDINLKIQGDGRDTRSFIFIDDFVNGVYLLLRKGKNQEIYNIGTSDEVKIRDLVKILAKVADVKIRIQKGPKTPGGTSRRCPDIRKILDLGFSPKTDLYTGLTKTYLWYNNFLFNAYGQSNS